MNTDIAKALESAKYNETVHLSLTDEEGNSHEVSLVACLDDIHGGIQWNPLSSLPSDGNEDSVDSAALCRHLRTKRWFFPMLNDHRRNETFHEAIQLASEEVVRRFQSDSRQDPNKNIQGLDIGSGTGLLVMMAARSLTNCLEKNESLTGRSVSITSIEMSSAMATIARATVASNELNDTITVVEGHSCEISPLEPKAHLCTSELLESGLLAEGWIPAMRDAWARHLDPNAVVVPQGARVFAQIVEGEWLLKYWGPNTLVTCFPDGRVLSLETDGSGTFLLGNSRMAGVSVPMHIEMLQNDPNYPIRQLSEPIAVLDIRVDSKDSVPPPEGQSRSISFLPISSGRAHAVLYWWQLNLHNEILTYSTEPGKSPWQDHWQQCIFVMTKPADECTELHAGQPATMKVSQNDTGLSFDILRATDIDRSNKKHRSTNEEVKILSSPQRAWQLNDVKRTKLLRDGMELLLQKKGMNAVVLDVSDFSLCAIMAALLGAQNVTSLEASSSALPEATARIAQLSNHLPLRNDQGKHNDFQIVRCYPEQLSADVLGGATADIVVAEPFYEVLEGWVLQEALNFFYIVRSLKERGVLSHDFQVMPLFASVQVYAFESFDIGGAYKPCDTQLCGFTHDQVNQYCTLHEHEIALEAWQYRIVPLTETFQVARLDYRTCTISQHSEEIQSRFLKEGTCHGMLIWIDYGIPTTEQTDHPDMLSTRGRSYQQVVRMLQVPAKVTPSDSFCCTVRIGKEFANGSSHYHFQAEIKFGDR